MKQNEESGYKISLKTGYRILYVVLSIFFLVCTLSFGILTFRADIDTILFGIGITGICLIFLLYALYGLTKKCEKRKEKVVYSFLLKKREYKLSDIAFFNQEIEEFYTDHGDGCVSSSWDKVTTFYNRQGKKLFKFGLAYDNVPLLVRDVKKTQERISNQEKK